MTARPEARTSLHHALLRRFVLMAALAAILVGLTFTLFGLEPMSVRIAENQFRASAEQVQARLDATFVPTQDLLRMSRLWIGGEMPEIDRAEPFNRLFLPMLDTLPHITSVVAGTSTGQGWLLLKQPDRSLRNRLTDIPRWHDRHRITDRPSTGNLRQVWLTSDYDARKRPWYTGAMAMPEETFHWTPPYAFFTTGEPGITVSTRFKLADGRDFVLGFDIKLRDLSKTTMQPLAGNRGMALVIADDRRVLALPPAPDGTMAEAWLDHVLMPGDRLGLAPLSDALAAWTPSGAGGVFAYRSGNADWLASFRPYGLGG
ncbi:MAG: hypothetical protein HGA75_14655, partial [Thiobacillus sp.]|nr:hypothetical protein [Thiobacillus sp.]